MKTQDLARQIKAKAADSTRFIVALAGPPASGKSTLAQALSDAIGPAARVVPMDGFHFDDRILAERDRLHRKGAADTFDVAGLVHLLSRLRGVEDKVAIPLFDRALEISRAQADIVTLDHRILIVEGNYLLLDEPPWRRLGDFFDLTVGIDVPLDEITARLRARWREFGKTDEDAQSWIETNDLPNARHVLAASRTPDITWHG